MGNGILLFSKNIPVRIFFTILVNFQAAGDSEYLGTIL
jgi:hypothetical protein